MVKMSFLYEKRSYTSEKNGLIRCVRILGNWNVSVGGYSQTNLYTNQMWKKAIRRIPKTNSIKKVLVLGLGAGGMIHILRSRYQKCEITAIEWDPVMVQIAKDLHLYSKNPPRIIIGDAIEESKKLTERFDLILVDLFLGPKVANAVHEQTFVKTQAELLEPDGYLIVNAFREPHIFSYFTPFLSCHATWRFSYNNLALYSHFGRGNPGDPLPPDYIPHRQSQEYLRVGRISFIPRKLVGEKGCYGTRRHVGPIILELYETDYEPPILAGPMRIIVWQPLSRKDAPMHWHRSVVRINSPRMGFAHISNPELYWESWTNHAKRHRKKWLRSQLYTIEETQDLERFLASYKNLPKLRMLKGEFTRLVQRRKQTQPDLTHLFVATDNNGSIVAGLAVLDTPEISHSNHLTSFIFPCAESTSVGTGLVDYWFQHAISKHIAFLNFGVFWTPGSPSSWKGFSSFKSQFGIFFIQKPRPLVRFVGYS